MRSAAVDRRLEAIAGPPLAQRSTPGTTVAVLDPMQDRTIYAVANITDYSTSYRQLVRVGSSNTNGAVSLNTHEAGNIANFVRFDTVGGSTNRTSVFPSNVGLVVAWGQIRSGMSLGQGGTLASTNGEISVIPGAGITDANVFLANPVAGCTPLWAGVYAFAHDQSTRTRVMAWLAQRYQVTPPPPLDSTCADLVLAA